MTFEKTNPRDEHRQRTHHRNADGLLKRINDHRWRGKQLEKRARTRSRTMELPVPGWVWTVANCAMDWCAGLRDTQSTGATRASACCSWFGAADCLPNSVNTTAGTAERGVTRSFACATPTHPHENIYPDYPEDRIDVTEEANQGNVESTVGCQASCLVRDLETELQEYANTAHSGIKDLVLAGKPDFHDLVFKKL